MPPEDTDRRLQNLSAEYHCNLHRTNSSYRSRITAAPAVKPSLSQSQRPKFQTLLLVLSSTRSTTCSSLLIWSAFIILLLSSMLTPSKAYEDIDSYYRMSQNCLTSKVAIQSLEKLLFKVGDKFNAHDLGCQEGFARFNRSCYYVGILQINWYTAKSVCKDMGGHLAVIDSYQEDQFIVERLLQKKVSSSFLGYWIDGHDKDFKNQWSWSSTGELISYSRWHKDQPDSNGDCMFLWIWDYEFNWADHHCNDKRMGFICELKADLPD